MSLSHRPRLRLLEESSRVGCGQLLQAQNIPSFHMHVFACPNPKFPSPKPSLSGIQLDVQSRLRLGIRTEISLEVCDCYLQSGAGSLCLPQLLHRGQLPMGLSESPWDRLSGPVVSFQKGHRERERKLPYYLLTHYRNIYNGLTPG